MLIDISFDLLLKEAFICGALFKSKRDVCCEIQKNKKDSRIENISTAPQALFAIEKGIIFEVSFKVCIGCRFPEFLLRMLNGLAV